MNCWRMDLWQKMTAYVHGALSADLVSKLEDHLADCESCRERLEELRLADVAATHLSLREAPDSAWEAIEKIISSPKAPHSTPRPRYLKQAFAGAAALFVVGFLFLIWNEGPALLEHDTDQYYAVQYREVALRDIPSTAEPHVATEGYVSEVSVDAEEGDTMFRLVDNLQRPNHFVICEIIPPLGMKVPQIGSRIRVYGVSRYDGKAEHQWFELHPVLNIEPAR